MTPDLRPCACPSTHIGYCTMTDDTGPVTVYTVTAYFRFGSTATAYLCTLAAAVAWCEEWLPLVSPEGKVVCVETPDYTEGRV